MLKFEKASPEETGIPAKCIANVIDRLSQRKIVMHSLLLMRHDKLVFEGYYAPYTADTLHRMFSISKSLTSIAIGLLADEGRISLDDTIVSYFPEKLPPKVHSWISSMTIKDMLMMRSCHASTTYKINMKSDWVESFFTTPPTLPPGRIFHYDTSAAHTLCALTEKLTGMVMLDYIKEKLDCLGFSRESYMLKDPFGVSIGGSGLVALPMDLLKFGYFIEHRGLVEGKQLISPEYIDMAVSSLSETCVTAPLPSEAQGYGMQFWRGEHNGYTCYGMGGQLIIFLPDYDIICVTTADTQGISGGNQQIYDALYEEILPYLTDEPLIPDSESTQLLKQKAATLQIEPLKVSIQTDTTTSKQVSTKDDMTTSKQFSAQTETVKKINGKTFTVQTADSGFESFTVSFDTSEKTVAKTAEKLSKNTNSTTVTNTKEKTTGTLSFVYNHEKYSLNFGIGCMQTGSFPIYNQNYAASGAWLSDGTLYIMAHIIDSYVGSVHFQLSFGDKDLTVFMRKKEETLFNEFNGHLYCVAV
ncbi:MAG: beta-lactamase family protein [Clostridiales bacterium]|nr:beta-lactamase family protein [Clostridiales bacterium]